MRYELSILRALLRLARRREVATHESLLERVGGAPAQLRAALRALEAQGLVERLTESAARLTMAGLAVAVAAIAPVGARRATRARRGAVARGRAA